MSYQQPQNNEIRTKYIKHHRIILLLLVLVWAFPMATNILILTGDENSQLFKICNLASFVSLLISGGLLTSVRFLTDSFLWLQMKKTMIEWKFFSVSEKETEEKLENDNDVWNLPLANAVSTFHHQRVVNNIIQIVLETCTESHKKMEGDLMSRIERHSTVLLKKKKTNEEGEDLQSNKSSIKEVVDIGED